MNDPMYKAVLNFDTMKHDVVNRSMIRVAEFDLPLEAHKCAEALGREFRKWQEQQGPSGDRGTGTEYSVYCLSADSAATNRFSVQDRSHRLIGVWYSAQEAAQHVADELNRAVQVGVTSCDDHEARMAARIRELTHEVAFITGRVPHWIDRASKAEAEVTRWETRAINAEAAQERQRQELSKAVEVYKERDKAEGTVAALWEVIGKIPAYETWKHLIGPFTSWDTHVIVKKYRGRVRAQLYRDLARGLRSTYGTAGNKLTAFIADTYDGFAKQEEERA